MTESRKPFSPSPLRELFSAAVIILLLAAAVPASGQQAVSEVLYAVLLNGELVSDGTIFLRDTAGALYVNGDDLRLWRLRQPSTPLIHGGAVFFPLSAYPGLRLAFDSVNQTLRIDIDPEAFEPTVLNRAKSERAAPATGAGAFFNYDFSWSGGGDAGQHLDSLAETGIFHRFGTGTSSFLWRDAAGGGELVRLETGWTSDDVERRRTVRIGDGFTRGGAMGRPVRFAGVQWARNFSTDPGFITFPTPAIGGLAERESVVDVYLNNVKQLSGTVPRGPFELVNVPVVAGRGTVGLVVKDLLGREHVVVEQYYASPALLKKGLSDFSVEAGFRRAEYAVRSNEYTGWLASGTVRRGLTDRFTGETHVELEEGVAMASVAGIWLHPRMGVFTLGIAQSRNETQWGTQRLLGYELATRRFNIGISSRAGTREFNHLGGRERPSPRVENRARLGFSFGRRGSAGLAFTHQRDVARGTSRILAASYNVNVSRGHLSLTALRTYGSTHPFGVAATYVLPLGSRKTLVGNSNVDGRSSRSAVEFQKTLSPSELGSGYRIRAADNGRTLQASVTRQATRNRLQFDVTQMNDDAFYRIGVSGAVGVLDGNAFASRWLHQSFGIVDLAGYGNVRVYANNQEVGRTDDKGRIFIQHLNPYHANKLRIEESDLPLDCRIDGTEITAVPYNRSGMSMKFPVGPVRGALMRIVTPDGLPLPAGTVMISRDREGTWRVGLRGEVYITDLTTGANVLEARVGESPCRLTLIAPEDLSNVPHLGDQICRFTD